MLKVVLVWLQVLDEYQGNFGDSWQSKTSDVTDPWPYLPDALAKFQVCDNMVACGQHMETIVLILCRLLRFLSGCGGYSIWLVA